MASSEITHVDYDSFIAELEAVEAHYGVSLTEPDDDMAASMRPFNRDGFVPREKGGRASTRYWARAMRIAENRAKWRAQAAGFDLNSLLAYVA